MIDFNDDFGILYEFNRACGLIATNLAPYISAHAQMGESSLGVEIPLEEICLPSLDDWWLLMDDKQSFFEIYTHKLHQLKTHNRGDYADHFKAGTIALKDYQNLWREYEKIKSDSTLKAMQYLPHRVQYAYDSLLKLDGFRRLNDVCAELDNVGLDVVLHPREDAQSLNEFNAYMLSLVIQSGDERPILQKITKKPNRFRLN